MTFTKKSIKAAPPKMQLSNVQVAKCIHSLSADVTETLENISEFIDCIQLKDSPLEDMRSANIHLKRALAYFAQAERSTWMK